MLGLIGAQTVFKGYQKSTKVVIKAGEVLHGCSDVVLLLKIQCLLLLCCAVLSVLPSLQLSRWGVSALCLFLTVPWVGLHCVIRTFPVIRTDILLRVGHFECIPVCNVIKLHVLHKIFIFSVHFVTR